MTNQPQPSSPQPQSSPPAPDSNAPAPSVPLSSPANPGGSQQPGATPPLPTSPLTGEPYDPEWGVMIQKGGGNQQTIQQVVKPEIERKAGQ